jgi:hypothetical protein
MMMKQLAAAAILLALAACTPQPEPGANAGTGAPAPGAGTISGSGPSNGSVQRDTGQALLDRLEREARAIAKAGPCADGGQCRTAPVGNRPCGGPREYIVYCAATTDSAALFARLGELAREEGDFNRRHQLASTCEFRMEPQTEVAGGTCRAKPAQ